MSLIGSTNEEKIWNYLKNKFGNTYGAAGMMGNIYAESALKPTNLQQSYEKKLGFTDDSYTKAVDNGTYNNFVKDSAGYGLCQWTYWSRKQNMLQFHKTAGKSIGDLETQLDFLMKELSTGYKSVLNGLKSAKSVREASDVVLLQFERPADQSDKAQQKRASYGQKFYDKYAKSTTTTTKPTVTTVKPKSVTELAKEVINGKWGNGSERKKRLEAAGYNYSKVQAEVNRLCKK